MERWRKASFQGAAGVLGEDHQVVVRSLDRFTRRDLHGRWGQRWEAFVDGTAGRVHWFAEDGRRHLYSDPPPAVVVLSSPPAGAQGADGARGRPDELAEALRVGVPVVLWDRRGGGDPSFRAALRTLLDGRDLRGLPGLVKALRIESGDCDPEEEGEDTVAGRVGRHVALLWDDPRRMPVMTADAPTGPPVDGEGVKRDGDAP
ncbi:hypothetical protein ABZ752_17745 [Streptomyces roseifaciens]